MPGRVLEVGRVHEFLGPINLSSTFLLGQRDLTAVSGELGQGAHSSASEALVYIRAKAALAVDDTWSASSR